MPAKKDTPRLHKKRSVSRTKKSSKNTAVLTVILNAPKKIWTSLRSRRQLLLARRPYRSFRLTRRRDYVRSMKLPGYWSFTNYVRSVLWSQKRLFITFLLVHATVTGLVVGLMTQDTFQLLNTTIKSVSENTAQGEIGGTTQNIALLAGIVTGAFSAPLTETQQIYAGLIGLVGWLTMVWLLRQLLAGQTRVRLRDGLYSSGSPIIATFLVLLIVLLQLLPASLAMVAYISAETVGAFDDALFTTLFWIIDIILILLSSYWLTSSLFALVIVTLPGMYPIKALKAAGDLVIGRRLRVLYRLMWLGFTIVCLWVIGLLPFIGFNSVVKIDSTPIVPVVVLLLSSLTLVWSSAYIYLLYRKMVDDGSAPA